MKANIIKSIFWGITIMIGLVVVDLIKGNEIDILLAGFGGAVMAIVDFFISLIFKKNLLKRINKNFYTTVRNI